MAALGILSFYSFYLHSIIFVLKLSITFGQVFITLLGFQATETIRQKGHLL